MNILSFNSSIGWITISEEKDLVTSIKFGKNTNKGKNIVLIKLKKQILEFIKGKRKKFSIKLHITGSLLQKKYGNNLVILNMGILKHMERLLEYYAPHHVMWEMYVVKIIIY